MVDRQGLDSEKHFQPLEKTNPISIVAAHCNLLQNVSKKPSPWPAARDALPVIRRARAIKQVTLGEKRDGPLRVPKLGLN